jgi:hypothetical protein
VVVKVNFSDRVKNEAFLSRYPQIPSYPHLFLLGSDGALLLSQTPDDFMKDDKYVPGLILAFLEKWEPSRSRASARGRTSPTAHLSSRRPGSGAGEPSAASREAAVLGRRCAEAVVLRTPPDRDLVLSPPFSRATPIMSC